MFSKTKLPTKKAFLLFFHKGSRSTFDRTLYKWQVPFFIAFFRVDFNSSCYRIYWWFTIIYRSKLYTSISSAVLLLIFRNYSAADFTVIIECSCFVLTQLLSINKSVSLHVLSSTSWLYSRETQLFYITTEFFRVAINLRPW